MSSRISLSEKWRNHHEGLEKMHSGVLDLRGKFEKQRGSRSDKRCLSIIHFIAREMPKLLTGPISSGLRDSVQEKLGRL